MIQYSYTTDVLEIQAAITFTNDPTSPLFTFDSSDMGLIGTYQVTVTGTTGSAGLSIESVTFTLNVLNPCLDPAFFSVQAPTLSQ